MKTYCVHVYPRAHEYENVRAKTAQEAEDKIVAQEFAGDWSEVGSVEVMLQCECGQDNDKDNSKCEECGKKL